MISHRRGYYLWRFPATSSLQLNLPTSTLHICVANIPPSHGQHSIAGQCISRCQLGPDTEPECAVLAGALSCTAGNPVGLALPFDRQDHLSPTAASQSHARAEPGELCLSVCGNGELCATQGDGHCGSGKEVCKRPRVPVLTDY